MKPKRVPPPITPAWSGARDCECGVKFGWPLKWIDVPQWCFRSDCCFHDFLYELGGTPADRYIADYQLYWDMKNRINETKPWWQRPGHKLIAWVYFRAVRQFGDRFYTYRADPTSVPR